MLWALLALAGFFVLGPRVFRLLTEVRDQFNNYKIRMRHQTTNLQFNVKQVLDQLKIAYVEEKIINIYFVDFFIAPNICLEVNGSLHYRADSHQATNLTLKKTRHLTNLGYKVVTVPYFEWIAVEKSAQKYVYIKRKLEIE